MSEVWVGILALAAGCYALKAAGLAVPERVLHHPLAERVAALIPVALLAALVAVQALADGRAVTVDGRLLGLGAAVALLVVRAPFLVVVGVAAAVAALARLVGWAP